MALTISLSPRAHADTVDVVVAPDVPPSLVVPDGQQAFLKGRAFGTQNYECAPTSTGFAWVLFTPEATLVDGADKQIITHFFSPNPDPLDPNKDPAVIADGAIRATWQHSRDGSSVWARNLAPPSFDSNFVRPNSVPWVLLQVVGRQEGLTGGDTLIPTTFIQRVNTSGGAAPTTGCSQLSDVGKKEFVKYSADYFFFLDPSTQTNQ